LPTQGEYRFLPISTSLSPVKSYHRGWIPVRGAGHFPGRSHPSGLPEDFPYSLEGVPLGKIVLLGRAAHQTRALEEPQGYAFWDRRRPIEGISRAAKRTYIGSNYG